MTEQITNHEPRTTNHDTIAAISTPLGEGGIGVVRLSGRDAFSIANKIFSPQKEDKDLLAPLMEEYPYLYFIHFSYLGALDVLEEAKLI